MKAKNASRATRTPPPSDAAEIERDRVRLRRQLDAIGAANKWLRTSLSKANGCHVGPRDVALLVRPVFEDPGPGRAWVAVLYTAEAPETPRSRRTPTSPEWTGADWFTALTSAVYDLVSDDVMDMVQRHADTSWFKFEDIFGQEVVP